MIAVDPSCAIDAARVEVNLSNGATKSVAIAHCRGSLARPMTNSELNLKFIAQVTRTIGAARATRAASQSWALPDVRNIAAFARKLAA